MPDMLIRSVDDGTRRRFRMIAAEHGIGFAEALRRIIHGYDYAEHVKACNLDEHADCEYQGKGESK